ncbi:Flp family type IVb pilin [Dietzia lutea]|uniref:Pilus assembly protein n=1 Tax=Dietzia lutea TaxID=546160 RepID=A0A2S1RAU7_9ACTN|nr:Flp family type IVb pilin [Dietzia lutea]AWH93385.1 hypothetical protein A6035_15685 [Dietzia lutea]
MNQAYYALATLQAFFSDRLDNRKDRGATAVEYGLMVGLIAVAIIAAVVFLGDTVSDMFAGTSNELDSRTEFDNVTVPAG